MPVSAASYSPLGWNDGDKRSGRQILLHNFQFFWKEILLLLLGISTALLSIAVFEQRSKLGDVTPEHSTRSDSKTMCVTNFYQLLPIAHGFNSHGGQDTVHRDPKRVQRLTKLGTRSFLPMASSLSTTSGPLNDIFQHPSACLVTRAKVSTSSTPITSCIAWSVGIFERERGREELTS